jgi:hypothetical protein
MACATALINSSVGVLSHYDHFRLKSLELPFVHPSIGGSKLKILDFKVFFGNTQHLFDFLLPSP